MDHTNGNGASFQQATQINDLATTVELTPRQFGRGPQEAEHFVQFYETDAFLLNSLRDFIGAGLATDDACIVVATEAHREGLDERLLAYGLDVAAARAAGRYVALDAAETLAQFMVNGAPEPGRFTQVIEPLVQQAAQGNRRVRIFGEMVALLWAEGNQESAIGLEELWNQLLKTHPFVLFCAYPMDGFGGERVAAPFGHVCSTHSRVVPAESYTALTEPDDRLRMIVELQQKAQALEAEIAERQRTEEQLRRSQQELSDFVENAVVGLHWVGPDGTILWANQAEMELLGYPREEYIGRHIAEFHADPPVIADILQCLTDGQQIHGYEARLLCKDGSIKDVLIDSNVYRVDGQFIHTRCFTRDISDRKRAEEALKQANRRKDEFLAMLAHELRNPLAPIRSAVEVLRRLGPPEPQLQQARDVIDRQVTHLTRLVDDLLDTARITQGKITLRKEKLELMTVIGRALETSRPLIEARRHQLHVSLPQDSMPLEGDLVRLAQVVSNLLNNAAKYTEEGGQIWLTAELSEFEILLRVRDNGVGISASLLPHLFDLFTQADRSLDRSEGGLGIGLALVRSLVEMHSGRVEAFSPGPNQGSEFVVHLPRLTKAALRGKTAAVAAAAPAPTPTSCRRILVVDDSVDSAACMALLFRLDGHEVQVAHDGRAALDIARMFQPQVVLLDIGLPGIDGYEVARRLREWPEMQKTILIALTGYGRAEDQRLAEQAGFDHHLTKPVDPDTVEALVNSLVLS